MKSLGNLLDRRKVRVTTLTDKDIFFIFNRVLKEEFGNVGAAKLNAEYFKNKTIFVRAASANWASELFTNRMDIIDKINQELGAPAIAEIKIK